MPKQFKCSEQDFSYFKSEVKKWINTFGLFDWDIKIDFNKGMNENNYRAACCSQVRAKMATIILYQKWFEEEPSYELLKATALHEILELILSPVGDIINEWVPKELREERVHSIIQRLIKVIL